MAKISTSREMRLEVLKIAANITCQLKDPKISTVETARQMLAFVDGHEEDIDSEEKSSPRLVRA